MQDVMDEKGQVLFDNLNWFAKKLCSVMTRDCVCSWQPRPQEDYVAGVEDLDDDDIDSDVSTECQDQHWLSE